MEHQKLWICLGRIRDDRLYKGGRRRPRALQAPRPPMPKTLAADHRHRTASLAGGHHNHHCYRFTVINILSLVVLPLFYPDSIDDAKALPDLHRHIPRSPCA
jgi:hypothetical protein